MCRGPDLTILDGVSNFNIFVFLHGNKSLHTYLHGYCSDYSKNKQWQTLTWLNWEQLFIMGNFLFKFINNYTESNARH